MIYRDLIYAKAVTLEVGPVYSSDLFQITGENRGNR